MINWNYQEFVNTVTITIGKSHVCYKLSENVELETNDIIGYIEDVILSESLNIDLDDLSEELQGLVAKTKVEAVVQAVKKYLEANEVTLVERIDTGVSKGLLNNCSDKYGDFVIKQPQEFSCKYYW